MEGDDEQCLILARFSTGAAGGIAMHDRHSSSPWAKLEPIGPVRTGCLCCPPKAETAPLGWDPDPGFGIVYLKRDGETVTDYMRHHDEEDGDATCMTVQDFEDRAAGDPDHDWRFEVHGPLGGVVYQRHGDAAWYAVERLEGFA